MIDITVLTVVHKDSGLVKYLIDSLKKYSDILPKIIVCDNGGNKQYLDEYMGEITIVKNKPKSKDGANIHGESINKIFKMVSSKYTLIIDSDCVVLSDDWCKFDKKYKFISAKKGAKGGIDKHHFCFTLFETEIFRNIDFRPVHSRQKQKRPWDTGCMVSQKVHDEKIPKEYLEVVGCTSGNCKIFGDRYPKAFELWRNKEPIVAHFGAGSDLLRRRINKYNEGYGKQLSDWKKTIEEYFKK